MAIAIVTGASSGMGREFVRQLSLCEKELDEIWAVARRTERLEMLQKECQQKSSVKIRPIPMNLTDPEFLKRIRELLHQEKPRVKLLINSAGFGKTGRFDQLSAEDQMEMCRLNVEALTGMTRVVLPYMTSGARIIQIASAAAFLPQPEFAVYAAGKSYVLSFSRALRQELKHRRINVTAVCPGPVRTEFFLRSSGQTELTGIKGKFMVNPKKVAAKALRDAAYGRALSVYSVPMKALRIGTKVLPHGLLLPVVSALHWGNRDTKKDSRKDQT